jgi:murein DD-endopeptidase MepM/ murein hydrolase activator NlpD
MLTVVAACLIVLPGPIARPFAPEGAYAGHWGIDVSVPSGRAVEAPLEGTVTFAGSVAGVRTVTIRSGRHQVSLSYLAAVMTSAGAAVRRGDVVGRVGVHDGHPGFHLSVRHDGIYLDPSGSARCQPALFGTLRLLPGGSSLP